MGTRRGSDRPEAVHSGSTLAVGPAAGSCGLAEVSASDRRTEVRGCCHGAFRAVLEGRGRGGQVPV